MRDDDTRNMTSETLPARRHSARGDAFAVLSMYWPFNTLPPMVVEVLAGKMRHRRFLRHQRLMLQGKRGNHLLVIVRGRVQVSTTQHGGARVRINTVGPGGVVGEMALVTHGPRTADVTALSDGEALALHRSDLERLLSRHPVVGVMLTELLAKRLGQANADVLQGKQLRGYRLGAPLGQGGMGVVYQATDLATGQPVALKMLSHRLIYSTAVVKRFQLEADVIRTLRHAHIVRVLDFFPAFSTFFIAMEMCRGKSAAELLRARGPMPEPTVRSIVGQIACALRYAHDHGVIHCDVKPANILVDERGAAKLTDFGIASFPEDSASGFIGSTGGTPRYMALEQFDSAVASTAFDTYALGVTACELLMGRALFPQESLVALIRAKATFTLPQRDAIQPGLSGAMHDFLGHCLMAPSDQRQMPDQVASWLRESATK